MGVGEDCCYSKGHSDPVKLPSQPDNTNHGNEVTTGLLIYFSLIKGSILFSN